MENKINKIVRDERMAQVTISINGFNYTVGCEDGQEGHLQAMANIVEQHIDMIRKIGGQSGEGRLLALASLIMADKLHDITNQLSALEKKQNEHEIEVLRNKNRELQEQLKYFSERAETIADRIEIA